MEGDGIKMVEEKDMGLTFSHKYIKNTSTCGMILTEHLLNAGRRPQTSKRARKSPCNWVGQKKKEEKRERERNRDRTCTPGRKLCKRIGFCTLGSPVTGGKISQDRGGVSGPWRRVQQLVCRGQSRERPAERVCAAAWHSPA